MAKKENRDGSEHTTRVANISAVAVLVFLGAVAFFRLIGQGEFSAIASMGLFIAAAFAVLIMFLRSLKNPYFLAFFTPAVLFLFYTILMVMSDWDSPFYFLACLCFCGISCIYSSFRTTVWYTVAQNIAIGILVFTRIPVAGVGLSFSTTIIDWIITLFGAMVLLLITRSGTVLLDIAVSDQKSFRSLMSTTSNYVIMVDDSNRVIHISSPMAKMANVGRDELAKGRPFIDLLPGRELKLFAYKMLEQKGAYEGDWEFILNGQKRFFRAVSTGVAGSPGETLITLHDMTHLAERDEIALMRDSLQIGLFFMDKSYIVQDQYSRFLEEMLSEQELFGRSFLDLLSASFNTKELNAIRDYFDMIFGRTFDQAMLKDINPLNELHYVYGQAGKKKVFHCDFSTIERAQGEIFVLVTIYDITARIELQKRLQEEETRRQEEMKTIFELIQVDSRVFGDFLADTGYEFEKINETFKKDTLSAHEALVEIYQSVHAIKSNAVILGLNTFGNKVHVLESKIKKLREQEEEVPFDDMLHLTVELDKLCLEKDGFKTTIDKIQSFNQNTTGGKGSNQSEFVLIESLTKTTNRAAEDLGKNAKFVVDHVDAGAIENGPRRVMKEVLMQLIRNSVAHGIEMPEERTARGKSETGNIHLSIRTEDEKIEIKLSDDGAGINFDKISGRALEQNIIQEKDKNNKGALLKAMFSAGFSTAETEGVHAGRGIGLNLVHDRVREANGSIKVQTEPGKGTSFIVTFPFSKEDAAPAAEEPVLDEDAED